MHFSEDTIQIQKKTPHYDSLYDIHKRSFYTVKKAPINIRIEYGATETAIHIPHKTPRGLLQKQAIFAEIEYLERYYESIVLFMTPQITIDATVPKRESMVSKKKEVFPWFKPLKREQSTETAFYLPEKMTFVLSPQYPYMTPYVYINEIPYLQKINCCHLERVKQIVYKYTPAYRNHLHCISCGSVMKYWRSSYRFSDIIDELQLIHRYKEIAKYEIVLGELIYHKELEESIGYHILSYVLLIAEY
jgi:hypothetical protein